MSMSSATTPGAVDEREDESEEEEEDGESESSGDFVNSTKDSTRKSTRETRPPKPRGDFPSEADQLEDDDDESLRLR
jgi:hypothetical protein